MAPTTQFAYMIAILMILTYPLINPHTETLPQQTKNAVKYAFFVSLVPLTHFIAKGLGSSSTQLKGVDLEILNLLLSVELDKYSIIFIPIALFVTWSILEFSIWYMQADPNINRFFKYLLIFLLMMILLVCSGSLFLLFLGWEGVGLMSFLLIGWYHTRSDAATAAMQAVLYNRVGDMGFLFAFCWLMKHSLSIHLPLIYTVPPSTLLLMGFITAAASKSAQFGLHPWLASAMEGPTPVSALLHSSTMVVAGIFLLIRIHPILSQNPTTLKICLCLGAISTLYAATCALAQNDIKKIIAYSTSSQLGLMMVAIGLNSPHLAFFHICTHAFFKAMLFLCSGFIIHTINDEQDIRKMGGFQRILPLTTSCLSIGSFALMAFPFLAGFYSKDAIIEATCTSYINSSALLLTLIATAFTAIYSMRLIYFSSMTYLRTRPIILYTENHPHIFNPLARLAIGSIIAGFFIHKSILPTSLLTHTMPEYFKITAITVTGIAFITAFFIARSFWTAPPLHPSTSKNLDPLHLNQVIHRTSTNITLHSAGQIINHLLTSYLLDKFGPTSLKQTQQDATKIVRISQKGLIKTYLTILFITLITTLLII